MGAKVAFMALIRHWPSSDSDILEWDRLAEKAQAEQSNPIAAAIDLSMELTPGIWLLLIGNAVFNLETVPAWYFDHLQLCRNLLPAGLDERIGLEIRAACNAAFGLKMLYDTPEGSAFPEEACQYIVEFAELASDSEYEHCYDLLILPINNLTAFVDFLTPESDLTFWERTAMLVDKMARAGGKPAQLAVGAISVAVVSTALSDRDPNLRFEAFKKCEIAVERLRVLGNEMRKLLADVFIQILLQKRFTWPLLLYFAHDDTAIPRRADVLAVIGPDPWPGRVRQLDTDSYLRGYQRLVDLCRLEFQIDNHRYELEQEVPPPSLAVGWTNWRFEHNAYRRAVPHSRSLLREQQFKTIILDFIHEVTHVLSLVGGLGMAASVGRVAAFYASFRIWEWTGKEIPVDALPASCGMPDLTPGDARALPAVMAVLAPLENARILQDIWTPWFEGVAVFAESASDPVGDETTINDVLLLIRNLVDFYPSGKTEEEVMQQFEAFHAEIEQRISATIHSESGDRLRMFFGASDSTYMAGYIIVRGIVAHWRQATQKPLSGAKCLQLLLHATRYLTTITLPDMSLPASAFRNAALESWKKFIEILTKLPGEDIDAFNLHPDRTAAGRRVLWTDRRLKQLDENSDVAHKLELQLNDIFDRVRAEFANLENRTLEDCSPLRLNGAVGITIRTYQEFARKGTNTRDHPKAADIITSIMQRMSLLPIGLADARFYLNQIADAEHDRLDVVLRTTERHVEGGGPSMDLTSIPISQADSETISANFATTGEPTLRVSRIVNVGDINSDESRFVHIYWLQYGNWQSIAALNHSAMSLLSTVPDKEELAEEISARIHPNSFQQFEQDLAAGVPFAEKVLSWIDRSAEWSVLSLPIEDRTLLDRVRESASFLAERSARVNMQSAASHVGLAAVFGRAPWIHEVISTGYDTLTAEFAYLRQKLADVIAASGRSPAHSEFLDNSYDEISSRLPIFIKTEFGWDIGPSHLVKETDRNE